MGCCSLTNSSDYEEDLENVCTFLAADTVTVLRKVWVHDITMKRKEKGELHQLVKELEEHPNCYEMYFRMTKEEFNFLHDLIRGHIKTRNTQFREAISTESSNLAWACFAASILIKHKQLSVCQKLHRLFPRSQSAICS
jgi:hypothetical protein